MWCFEQAFDVLLALLCLAFLGGLVFGLWLLLFRIMRGEL